MAEPFLAEIRMVSFNFAPKGWALCNGQLMPINQNQALFALLGTTYGGNGQTTFALPDLQGRTPIHVGREFNEGQNSGEVAHTLSIAELPEHTHNVNAISTNTGNVVIPTGAFLATSAPAEIFTSVSAQLTALAPNTITAYGGSQPHNNMQPYLAIGFCIALQGIFPSPN